MPTGSGRAFRLVAVVSALWAYLTILLGANVTFTGSGLACPDWPICSSGQWITYSGPAGIEFLHRTSAFVLSILVLVLFLLAVFGRPRREAWVKLSGLSFLSVVVQALVGGAIIVTQESEPVVVAHLALATALFGLLVLLALVANLPYLPRRWRRGLLGEGEGRGETTTPTPSAPGAGPSTTGTAGEP